MKRAIKYAIWVVNYELWRYNIKLTAKVFAHIRAKKADEETWQEAANGEG